MGEGEAGLLDHNFEFGVSFCLSSLLDFTNILATLLLLLALMKIAIEDIEAKANFSLLRRLWSFCSVFIFKTSIDATFKLEHFFVNEAANGITVRICE